MTIVLDRTLIPDVKLTPRMWIEEWDRGWEGALNFIANFAKPQRKEGWSTLPKRKRAYCLLWKREREGKPFFAQEKIATTENRPVVKVGISQLNLLVNCRKLVVVMKSTWYCLIYIKINFTIFYNMIHMPLMFSIFLGKSFWWIGSFIATVLKLLEEKGLMLF